MGYPFGHTGSLFCPIAAPCASQPPRTVLAALEAEASLALCSAVQQKLKHWYVINTVFLVKQKHNIILDTVKEKSILSQLKPVQ